jgi:hypothetical protein
LALLSLTFGIAAFIYEATETVRIIVANQQGVLLELRYVAGRWRMDYNHNQPHSSLNYMAPAAFGAMYQSSASAMLHRKIEVEDD